MGQLGDAVNEEVAVRQFGGAAGDAPQPSLDNDPVMARDTPWRRRLALLGITVMTIGVLLGLGLDVHTTGSAGEVSCGPAWEETATPAADDVGCAAARQSRGGTSIILLVLGGAMTGLAVTGRRSVAGMPAKESMG